MEPQFVLTWKGIHGRESSEYRRTNTCASSCHAHWNRSKLTFAHADSLAAGHKGPHGNDAANTHTRGVGVRNGRYNYYDDRQQCQPLLRPAGPFVVC